MRRIWMWGGNLKLGEWEGVLRNTVVSQGLRGDLSPKTAKRLATAQGDVGPRGAASFAHGPYPRIYAPELGSSRVLGWCGPHSGWAHGTRVRAPVADPGVGWGALGGALFPPSRVGRTARAFARPRLTPGTVGGVSILLLEFCLHFAYGFCLWSHPRVEVHVLARGRILGTPNI